MNRHEHSSVSDEELNAYIDDELEFDERKRIFHTLEEDDHLTHEARELRQLRAMLRNAYRNPPAPPSAQPNKRSSRDVLAKGIAAALLVTVGVAGGWIGNQEFSGERYNLTPNTFGQPVSMNEHAQDNLLLHISSNDPAKMEAALNYAEQLLADKRRQGKTFRLEVVANNGGVELLRRDTSPFPERIESLLGKYDNVSFLACANALKKLRERGVKVELIPGTRSDHTAIDEIVERLEGGWRYLKV